MEEDFESKCHKLESSHWWFIGRRNCICRIVRHLKKNAKILDIGCGGGSTLLLLKSKGFDNLYGIDISKKAVNMCKSRGMNQVFLMDAQEIDMPGEKFDFIIASDVIEHLSDDGAALLEFKRILKPGGSMVAFVPAFNWLWNQHDIASQHYRRYSKSQFISKLRNAGFEIVKSSYWNMLGFFPTAALHIISRNFLKTETDRLYGVPHLINSLLIEILKIENFLIEKASLPIGLSILVIAKKPEDQKKH